MVESPEYDESESLDDAMVIGPIERCQPPEPAMLGRFKVVRLCAREHCTKSYEVTTPDPGGGRLLLKLVDTDKEDVASWFEKYAAVTTAVNHPHILPCHESGRVNGRPYVVMPMVDGASLHEMVIGAVLPSSSEVVRITRSIADALDYAHSHEVVHGNVHPKHVLMDRSGHTWLTGFAEIGPGYPEGMGIGNPQHLAPEQLEGLENTVAPTDVYALGEIAFLLLTGSSPFGRFFGMELFERKCSGSAPSARELRPEIPRPVDFVLERAMAVRPEDGFPTAGQFVSELERALGRCQKAPKKWWRIWF